MTNYKIMIANGDGNSWRNKLTQFHNVDDHKSTKMSEDKRDDIITAVETAGYYARKRDWSLGKTIICARKTDVDVDGLSILVDVVTLVPQPDALWSVQYAGFKSSDTVVTTDIINFLNQLFANEGDLFKSRAAAVMQRIGRKRA